MDFHKCPFCDHNNPADSKYCSECGGCLYLLPCPGCGAINDVKADTCYQCSARLRGGAEENFATAGPVAVVSAKPASINILSRAADLGALDTTLPVAPAVGRAGLLSHPRGRLILGTVLLAAVGVAGYFGYRQHFQFAKTSPTAAGGEAHAPTAGVIRGGAVAGESTPSASAAQTPAVGPSPATPGEPQAVVEARSPRAAAVKGSDGASAQSAACTDSAATLGLCGAAPGQGKAAEPSSAIKAANPRAEASDTGKAGRQESSAPASCAEAATALGLCTQTPAVPAVPAITHTQRKE